jgi:CDP-glucose 4,6-dehydratase
MGIRKSGVESVGIMDLQSFFSNNFKGKKVLVTGHTGFKGGWLSLWLESLGAKVIGFSTDPPTMPAFFNETGLSHRIIDIRGDVLDQTHLLATIDKYKPEFIFHLAAQPLVRNSYADPLHTFKVNTLGTANILESIRISKLPAVCICITSDKCYENREWDYAYRENDPMGGYDPYSASKGAAEIVISSYRKSFQKVIGCAIASVRAGNVIGGGDWANDRLVPDCIRSLTVGEKIKIRNPGSIRPWQFVLEPLAGYLLLACRMKENPITFSEAWNFGPEYSNSIDVRTLTELVIEEWNSGEWEDVSINSQGQVHEAAILKLDIAKAVTRIGWKPIYEINDTIKKTVGWYKNYYENNLDPYVFSLDQINEYCKQAKNKYPRWNEV